MQKRSIDLALRPFLKEKKNAINWFDWIFYVGIDRIGDGIDFLVLVIFEIIIFFTLGDNL